MLIDYRNSELILHRISKQVLHFCGMQENKDDKRHLLKAGCLRFLWQVALWLAIGYVTYQRWQPAGLWNWLGYIGVWTLLTVVAGLLAEGLFRQWSKRAG